MFRFLSLANTVYKTYTESIFALSFLLSFFLRNFCNSCWISNSGENPDRWCPVVIPVLGDKHNLTDTKSSILGTDKVFPKELFVENLPRSRLFTGGCCISQEKEASPQHDAAPTVFRVMCAVSFLPHVAFRPKKLHFALISPKHLLPRVYCAPTQFVLTTNWTPYSP